MKKNLLRIVLLLLILAIPSINGISLIELSQKADVTSEYKPVSIELSDKKVSDVEKYISGLLEQRAKEEEEKRQQLEREEKFRLFLEGIKRVKRHSHNDGCKAEAERDSEHGLSRGLKRIERALEIH